MAADVISVHVARITPEVASLSNIPAMQDMTPTPDEAKTAQAQQNRSHMGLANQDLDFTDPRTWYRSSVHADIASRNVDADYKPKFPDGMQWTLNPTQTNKPESIQNRSVLPKIEVQDNGAQKKKSNKRKSKNIQSKSLSNIDDLLMDIDSRIANSLHRQKDLPTLKDRLQRSGTREKLIIGSVDKIYRQEVPIKLAVMPAIGNQWDGYTMKNMVRKNPGDNQKVHPTMKENLDPRTKKLSPINRSKRNVLPERYSELRLKSASESNLIMVEKRKTANKLKQKYMHMLKPLEEGPKEWMHQDSRYPFNDYALEEDPVQGMALIEERIVPLPENLNPPFRAGGKIPWPPKTEPLSKTYDGTFRTINPNSDFMLAKLSQTPRGVTDSGQHDITDYNDFTRYSKFHDDVLIDATVSKHFNTLVSFDDVDYGEPTHHVTSESEAKLSCPSVVNLNIDRDTPLGRTPWCIENQTQKVKDSNLYENDFFATETTYSELDFDVSVLRDSFINKGGMPKDHSTFNKLKLFNEKSVVDPRLRRDNTTIEMAKRGFIVDTKAKWEHPPIYKLDPKLRHYWRSSNPVSPVLSPNAFNQPPRSRIASGTDAAVISSPPRVRVRNMKDGCYITIDRHVS